MKKLRSGYTTGACAAAAAKGAALELFNRGADEMTIAFPDGSRHRFSLLWRKIDNGHGYAAVRKDAGDDPDVTNGAEIVARVRRGGTPSEAESAIAIVGGDGVGLVTKPGLAVPVGSPAINPVPQQMIRQAVGEALQESGQSAATPLEVCIEVPQGEVLATKTLNARLGVIGGISILGTTGIVKPISAEAWTATIATSMKVALATGNTEIVLATGRTSERAVQAIVRFPEEALIMMGDYLEFSLLEARKYPFHRIHMAAMWAKLLKGAMRKPHTHVRHGMLEIEEILAFLRRQNIADRTLDQLRGAHTAREILERLLEIDITVIDMVCGCAKKHYEDLIGLPVSLYLVGPTGKILYRS